ncbi:MAG TPA: CpsD/CapB family tyrosine-protein kinase [Blastocatellia bacterium]|nr:CpsD/CapB family tyrosine-protein kinase [Blastocatellia bacterium]
MGKVYEALKKAESEGNPPAWSSVAVEPVTEDRNKGGNAFDFVNYSLNAPDAAEIEERSRERAAAQAARKELAQPSREIAIDLQQIAPQLISFHDINTNAAEEYNRLAVTLITSASERTIKRVLVASAQHGEGRTSVTLNLACALARAHKRVLVVDTDLHSPSLLRFLGLSTEVGLTDALTNGLPAGSAVIRVQPFGFDLLPTREQAKNPAELLSSSSFREMLELLDTDYDFILFDSPPLLTVADSSLLVRYIDKTVLVIRSGKTSSGQIGRAIAPLTQEKILGVVLNRAGRAA